MASIARKIWTPFRLTSDTYAVLLLNQPIQIGVASFKTLWNGATFRVCVDGGSNQLFNFARDKAVDLLTPNLVTGDFDSILPEVKGHYEGLGAKIVQTEDQDFTDFTKALKELFAGAGKEYPTVKSVLVINEPSGRHDQFFANISTLCKFGGSDPAVYIMSDESVSWVIGQGSHRLDLDQTYVDTRPFCGLIPINGPTKITTEGLRWNLDDSMECSFGPEGMVSTSNEIAAKTVDIDTDKTFLWTMKSF